MHQSALIRSDIIKSYKYDTSFRIAGDTNFFAKAYNAGLGFQSIDVVVSSFALEGVSSHLSWLMFKEECLIGFQYNRLFPLIHALKYIFWTIPRVGLRLAIPKQFRNQIRILLSKNHS